MGMQLNAEMNNITAERFNVAGAMLAKLFGQPGSRNATSSPRRAAGVRDVGITTAMYSRVLLDRARARRRRSAPRSCTGSAATSRCRARSRGRHRRRVRALRRADVPTARAAHELARRRAHRARVVRAGVRGARLPGRDRRACRTRPTSSIRRAASSSTTCGSVIRPGRDVSLESLETPGTPGRRRAERLDPARRLARRSSPARPSRSSDLRARARRRSRCSCRACTTSSQGAVRDRRPRRARPHARLAARRDRARAAGPAPLPRHDPRQPAVRAARRDRRRARRRAATRARIWDLVDVAARRSRHRRRRTRLPHVGRREATARDRAPAAEEPARS